MGLPLVCSCGLVNFDDMMISGERVCCVRNDAR
jgi:hypothetical protein